MRGRARLGSWGFAAGLVVVAWGLLANVAWAASGAARLKGQILVSDEPIPTLDDEAKMVDVLRKWQKTVIAKDEGSDTWTFRMMSFPDRKPGVSTLSLLFYDVSSGKKTYLTSKDISCDAGATILASEVDVSVEDGIKPGMKVEMSLSKISGDRQTDLARTRLTFK
jgi:hypothetical protein